MGDSTQQARAFMRTCQSALAGLEVGNTANIAQDHLTKALSDVQSGAKRNHARAIYRAAQDTLNAVQTSQPVTPHLHTLSHLLALYEEGLIELEGLEQAGNQDKGAETEAVAEPSLSPEAQRKRSEDALRSTLHLASSSEKPVLSTLLSLSTGEPIDETQNHTAKASPLIADNTPSAKVPNLSDVTAEIAMDAYISEIVQIGLSEARQRGLTLSLSYDVIGLSLSKLEAEKMRKRLEAWISRLVLHLSIHVSPEELGHIDISAKGKSLQLTANAPALAGIIMSAASDMKMTTQTVDPETGHLVLTLSVHPINKAKPAPKMPVEDGIGARLGALMEPIDEAPSIMDEESSLVLFEPKRAV